MRVFFALVVVALTAFAVTPAAAQAIKRDVLALIDFEDEATIRLSQIHNGLETPLNHMGYRVHYRDIREGLPTLAELDDYAAVVSWFEGGISLEASYFLAASAAMDAGVKWIVLGELGVSDAARPSPAYAGFLERLGLADTTLYVAATFDSRVAQKDPAVIGYEADIDEPFPAFAALAAVGADTDVALSVTSPYLGVGEEAVLVATSAKGGYAASGFVTRYVTEVNLQSWIIDPFAFLGRALDPPLWPIPDTATVSGQRSYFSHIDGDGWANLSRAAGYEGQSALSADVIRIEAIEAYPDLPVTVGVIGGDVLDGAPEAERAQEATTALFGLPQVEVASHTMTHPFNWGALTDYDREAELADLDARRQPATESWMALGQAIGMVDHESHSHDGSSDPIRAYGAEPFDIDNEVQEALTLAEAFAPPGKRAEVYLWSGDTGPDARLIAATREAGVINLNGGDTRFDATYPSLIYVAPLSRPVDGERQIYAVMSNENTYTNLWRGPHYGQMLLEETWERTGSPRRLRPQNLYYHMYAGERSDSLAALVHHLDLARADAITPIEASTYGHIVNGFFSAEIVNAGDLAWRIRDRGGLATVRFDLADRYDIDMDTSTGVLGGSRHAGSLYAALDAGDPQPLVRLKPLSVAADASPVPALIASRWIVSDYDRAACGATFDARGYGRPEMAWQAAAGTYRVVATQGGQILWEDVVSATDDGVLTFSPDLDGMDAIAFAVTCAGSPA